MTQLNNYPIYLASKSPRRQNLLKQLGIKFKILIPKISECISEKNPQLYAIKIAHQKVNAVENKVHRGIIIGVDTIVTINKKILGKPKNRKDARRMLNLLSGRTHHVISGLCLLSKPDNTIIIDFERTKVKFRKLTEIEIENYLKTKEPYDKAGAYGIQGKARLFVERIEGCYLNVVGLPVSKLIKHLNYLNTQHKRNKN
ncbi:MAG: Maf family protein [candidate division WOR-3 bacterium]|nr:Maf family protein [candidate division WOR-3 bacterium]